MNTVDQHTLHSYFKPPLGEWLRYCCKAYVKVWDKKLAVLNLAPKYKLRMVLRFESLIEIFA